MNQRRSNIEIISEMLRIGAEGAGKTEIMYSANMSYRQLQKYLKFMMAQGLIDQIEVGNPSITFIVTEKGHGLRRSIETVLEVLQFNITEEK
ncbi:MAG: winged helix-turn-helix domain-containing protein [Dehalococcoidia bacterium]|nr:winged helix-turn-helix domain-containing protein [Dehalococcoidia bacterium]MDD5647918.1 winged helix-turn-helix domain-containing protein [Dehalococcoidia bacterium]